MAAISQATISHASSWMESVVLISLKFVPKGSIFNGLALNRQQAITWTKAYIVDWRIYVAPGGDELTHWSLRQNGHHSADDIFKCIFMIENLCILIQMLLKFNSQKSNWQWISIGLNIWLGWQAVIWTYDGLVCWCMYVSLGLNTSTDAWMALHVSVNWVIVGTGTMVCTCLAPSRYLNWRWFISKYENFHSNKWIWKCCAQNVCDVVQASMYWASQNIQIGLLGLDVAV